MSKIDKKDVLETMIYNIIEGSQTIDQAKADAEHYHDMTISLQRGDLIYIRSRVIDFVQQNEQWVDDGGKIQTSDSGSTLLSIIDK